MNAIVILSLFLLILMLVFGGRSGFVSFLTLFLNFIVLFIAILFIVFRAPIYLVTFVFVSSSLSLIFFYLTSSI